MKMKNSSYRQDGRVLSAGFIVARRGNPGWLFLLLRAFGYWDFPKGIVERGEDPWDAALREVREETTIADLRSPWGRIFMESAPYLGGRKVARYYLGETRREHVELPVNPQIGKPEHDAYAWLDFEKAMSMLAPRVRPCLRWGYGVLQGLRPGDRGGDR